MDCFRCRNDTGDWKHFSIRAKWRLEVILRMRDERLTDNRDIVILIRKSTILNY